MAGHIGTAQSFNESQLDGLYRASSTLLYGKRLRHQRKEERHSDQLGRVENQQSNSSSLVAPRKPGDLPYAEIIEVVKAHHSPRPTTIVQRFRLNSPMRQHDESVRPDVAEFTRLSQVRLWEQLGRNVETQVGVWDQRTSKTQVKKHKGQEPEAVEDAPFVLFSMFSTSKPIFRDLEVMYY